jgi:hypothetical protein
MTGGRLFEFDWGLRTVTADIHHRPVRLERLNQAGQNHEIENIRPIIFCPAKAARQQERFGCVEG